MAAELPRKPLCEILKDPDGSRHYIVARSPVNKDLVAAQIDIWWNRNGPFKIGGRKIVEEVLFLRQQEGDRENADVIVLTHAQCYALLDAVSRAIESR